VSKPFHKDELVARIRAIVRRSKGHAESVIRTGDLVVNVDTMTVEVNGRPLHLTCKEYQILELLSLRKGTTLIKEMFLDYLYGGMDEPEQKIIDVFICKLRKEARLCLERQGLHRDCVGSRLCTAGAERRSYLNSLLAPDRSLQESLPRPYIYSYDDVDAATLRRRIRHEVDWVTPDARAPFRSWR